MPFRRKLRYLLEAGGFFALMAMFGALGVDTASALGGVMGRRILYRTSVTKRARDNLRAAYPEKTADEIEAIIIEMWDNLGRTIAEYPHLEKFSFRGPDPRIEIGNMGMAVRAIEQSCGILFVSGHFANWEIMPLAATEYGLEGGLVYRPLNNPYVDRWMVKQRGKRGPKEHLGKGAPGTKRLFTLLRGGKAIFMLVDQKTSEGVPAPFFGRIAMTTPAPAALALKLGAVILPVSNERLRGARFRMTVHEPMICKPSGDHARDVLDVTCRINDVLERAVRYRPSQWVWIHRRWPKEGDKPRSRRGREAQALGGDGVRVDSDGSSFV